MRQPSTGLMFSPSTVVLGTADVPPIVAIITGKAPVGLLVVRGLVAAAVNGPAGPFVGCGVAASSTSHTVVGGGIAATTIPHFCCRHEEVVLVSVGRVTDNEKWGHTQTVAQPRNRPMTDEDSLHMLLSGTRVSPRFRREQGNSTRGHRGFGNTLPMSR